MSPWKKNFARKPGLRAEINKTILVQALSLRRRFVKEMKTASTMGKMIRFKY